MPSNWPFPRILAHRGGGTLAPENTLAALRCGLAHGFHAVEFDVMLTHDGVPVLMHDEILGRTVKGNAAVSTLESAQLCAMDAGSWFGTAFAGTPVPTYHKAFEFCRTNAIWMNVEIKPARGYEQVTGRVVAELTQAWLAAEAGSTLAPPLLSSFSHEALLAAQTAAPVLPRGWLVDRIPADWQARLQEVNALALHTNQRHLSAALAREVKAAGYGLFCYTVNTSARAAELLSWGVDGFLPIGSTGSARTLRRLT